MDRPLLFILVTLLAVSMAAAQEPAAPAMEELPPIKTIISDSDAPNFSNSPSINPADPFSMRPMQVPQNQSSGADNSTLPLPMDKEMFEFFQPGYQLGDDATKKDEIKPEPKIVEQPKEKKVKKARKPKKLKRFNYSNQHLPSTIYKKEYSGQNRHLPKATHGQDYDRATFIAAANNNLNAVRALIESGRSLSMRNGKGSTLMEVAVRYGAHDVVRYLLAKRAPAGDAMNIAMQKRDSLSVYAMRSVGY